MMAYSLPAKITFKTLSALTPPVTPSGLTPTAGSNRVRLNWTAVSGATGYVVQWKVGSEEWVEGYNGPLAQATITGLTPDTEYDFRLKATNAAGDSAWVVVTVKTKSQETFTRIIRLTKAEAFSPEPEGFVTIV